MAADGDSSDGASGEAFVDVLGVVRAAISIVQSVVVLVSRVGYGIEERLKAGQAADILGRAAPLAGNEARALGVRLTGTDRQPCETGSAAGGRGGNGGIAGGALGRLIGGAGGRGYAIARTMLPPDLATLLEDAISVRKRPISVDVRFARMAGVCDTLEGPVAYAVGDAILTGVAQKKWPVPAAYLHANYVPEEGVIAGQDGRYLKSVTGARAMQLTEPLSIEREPGGATLHGHAGDWLLAYDDGTIGIVGGSIFAESYERLRS